MLFAEKAKKDDTNGPLLSGFFFSQNSDKNREPNTSVIINFRPHVGSQRHAAAIGVFPPGNTSHNAL